MQRTALVILLLAGAGACGQPEVAPAIAEPERREHGDERRLGEPDWQPEASTRGPVLGGIVFSPDGAPLAGIEVRAHGGLATRWVTATTQTDEQGRYVFVDVQGASMRNERHPEGAWFVGVCVGRIQSGNPAAYLPWADISVPVTPGTVRRLDFEYDPASVPEAVRVDSVPGR